MQRLQWKSEALALSATCVGSRASGGLTQAKAELLEEHNDSQQKHNGQEEEGEEEVAEQDEVVEPDQPVEASEVGQVK